MSELQRGHNHPHQFSSLTTNYFHLPVVIGITHTILERKREGGEMEKKEERETFEEGQDERVDIAGPGYLTSPYPET